jgi:hypothetical protein
MKKLPPHLDSDFSLVAFLKLVLKPTQKKHKTCNNNAFNRLRNSIVKQQARNPVVVSKKKKERRKVVKQKLCN